jgi:hypothetical protein
MKIKMLRDVFVFKKGMLYDVIDYDDKKYIVLIGGKNETKSKINQR